MATSSSCGLICVKSRNCANFVQLLHVEPSKQYKCIHNWIRGRELTCKVFNHPSAPSYTDRHRGVIITPKTPRGRRVEIISPDYTDPKILNFRKKTFLQWDKPWTPHSQIRRVHIGKFLVTFYGAAIYDILDPLLEWGNLIDWSLLITRTEASFEETLKIKDIIRNVNLWLDEEDF